MKKESQRVVFETEYCVGCRTCMIACSFHHRRVFSPSISSIEIEKGEMPAIRTAFNLCPNDLHLACDGCHGLETPLCVKYCNALARDELRSLLAKFLSLKNLTLIKEKGK